MEFDEVQFARNNYRFTIYVSLALAVFAFIFSLITLDFKHALIIAGFVLFFGFVLGHPRVIEEIHKATVPPSDEFRKHLRDKHKKKKSAAYQHLPGNRFHGSYTRNYYPF